MDKEAFGRGVKDIFQVKMSQVFETKRYFSKRIECISIKERTEAGTQPLSFQIPTCLSGPPEQGGGLCWAYDLGA